MLAPIAFGIDPLHSINCNYLSVSRRVTFSESMMASPVQQNPYLKGSTPYSNRVANAISV